MARKEQGMTTLREAAQQFVTDYENGDLGDLKHYARALRAALEQPEPAFDALVAISLLTHLGGEVADYEDVVEAVRRLHAVNAELLEALLEERRVRLMGQEDDVHWESLRDMRRAAMAATDAAIAKAEGA
jgi:hypothetical protein